MLNGKRAISVRATSFTVNSFHGAKQPKGQLQNLRTLLLDYIINNDDNNDNTMIINLFLGDSSDGLDPGLP